MRGEGAGRGNDELQPPVILPGPLERRHKCSRPTSDSPSTSPISICPECPPLPSAFPFLARSGSLPSSSQGCQPPHFLSPLRVSTSPRACVLSGGTACRLQAWGEPFHPFSPVLWPPCVRRTTEAAPAGVRVLRWGDGIPELALPDRRAHPGLTELLAMQVGILLSGWIRTEGYAGKF